MRWYTAGMAHVDIKPESYDALKVLAERQGSTVESMVQMAVEDLIRRQESSPDEWLKRWRAVQFEIQAGMPDGVSGEEIEREIDEAINEVRAERRARGR